MASEFDEHEAENSAEVAGGNADITGDCLGAIGPRLTIVVGRCRLSREHALQLAAGQLVPLDEPTDWPVEVLADGEPVARGELVAIDGYFGVRITELIGASAGWKAA